MPSRLIARKLFFTFGPCFKSKQNQGMSGMYYHACVPWLDLVSSLFTPMSTTIVSSTASYPINYRGKSGEYLFNVVIHLLGRS